MVMKVEMDGSASLRRRVLSSTTHGHSSEQRCTGIALQRLQLHVPYSCTLQSSRCCLLLLDIAIPAGCSLFHLAVSQQDEEWCERAGSSDSVSVESESAWMR